MKSTIAARPTVVRSAWRQAMGECVGVLLMLSLQLARGRGTRKGERLGAAERDDGEQVFRWRDHDEAGRADRVPLAPRHGAAARSLLRALWRRRRSERNTRGTRRALRPRRREVGTPAGQSASHYRSEGISAQAPILRRCAARRCRRLPSFKCLTFTARAAGRRHAWPFLASGRKNGPAASAKPSGAVECRPWARPPRRCYRSAGGVSGTPVDPPVDWWQHAACAYLPCHSINSDSSAESPSNQA